MQKNTKYPLYCLLVSRNWMQLYIFVTKLDNSTISLKDVIPYNRCQKYVFTSVKFYIY
jgi:hypothetical protein